MAEEPPTEEPSSPRLGLTSRRDLIIAALAGGGGAWVILKTIETIDGQPPMLPWTGPVVLLFVASLIAALAITTWRRIQTRRESVEPQRAVAYLALGKASALGGTAIAAGYLVLALMGLPNLAAEGPQQRLVRGLVAAVAGVLIAVFGLILERACKVPESGDEDDSDPSER